MTVFRADGARGAVHDRPSRMTIGVNYPWGNFGADLGGETRPPAWQANLQRDLHALKAAGVKVLRWFMLCDGAAYGRPEQDPDPAERWWGQRQWRFRVPRSPDAILADFRLLLSELLRSGTGIQLLPVVMSCSICYPVDYEQGPFGKRTRSAPPATGRLKNGRADLVFDPRKSAVFFDTLLRPMLQNAAEPGFRELIYAFEVMNEPEWCTQRDGRVTSPKQTIPEERMKTFLKDAAALIQTQFRATVGFAEHATYRAWGGRALGLDIPQFHYYGRPVMVPRCTEDMIVGEFATRPMPRVAARQGVEAQEDRQWRALGRDQSVLARLCHLEAKGYRTAFVWAMRTNDIASATAIWPQALSDIRDYLQGTCRRGDR